MHTRTNPFHEQQVAAAFNSQSVIFDALYGADGIIQYKRERVRAHVSGLLKPGSSILELNAGTGEDAMYFASEGHTVHATDISSGMQEQIKAKINSKGLAHLVSTELCSFTRLNELKNKGPYDLIFSNFAGLNCTQEIDKVMDAFSSLLKPAGIVTLVMLPRFCLWEFLLLFKGKFRTATRRFFSSNGRKAKIDSHLFTCWYHSPRHIQRCLQKDFSLVSMEGLCCLVPPSYMENFTVKHPGIFSWLRRKEDKYKSTSPLKFIGDYFIITLRKK
jgi:ubiquinone/menaquinone biosynthesis C-methylase UbiE